MKIVPVDDFIGKCGAGFKSAIALGIIEIKKIFFPKAIGEDCAMAEKISAFAREQGLTIKKDKKERVLIQMGKDANSQQIFFINEKLDSELKDYLEELFKKRRAIKESKKVNKGLSQATSGYIITV